MADVTMLYTTVRNPNSFTRVFGYLGAHGKSLPAKAHFTQFGDLVTSIAPNNIQKTYRKVNALSSDLLANLVEIISTPAVILKDTVNSQIKALQLSGGALGVVDPSWGAYTDV